MSILGRLFGVVVVGPIGAVGPTEASKRSKKQITELQKQTELLEKQNEFLGVPPKPAKAGWEYWSGAQKTWAVIGIIAGVLLFFCWPLLIGANTDAQGKTSPSLGGFLLWIVWLPISIWLVRRLYRDHFAPTTASRSEES